MVLNSLLLLDTQQPTCITAWCCEPFVWFRPTFYFAGFIAIRAIANTMRDNCPPKRVNDTHQLARRCIGQLGLERQQRLQCSFETDSPRQYAEAFSRLGHYRSDQVISQGMHPNFFSHGIRSFAAKHIHLHRCFQRAGRVRRSSGRDTKRPFHWRCIPPGREGLSPR